MKPVITAVACIIFCISLVAQRIDPVLNAKLQGKTNLDDIMTTVMQYYKTDPAAVLKAGNSDEEFEKNPVLKWARWGWYMSSRTNPGGELVNITEKMQQAVSTNPSLVEARAVNSNPAPNAPQASTASWSFVGPSSSPYTPANRLFNGLGRCDRIAFDPNNTSNIYIGTPAGGLWRSTDGGTSWSNLTKYLPSPGISGIVVSSANSNTIYILTGEGDTWEGGFVNAFGYTRSSAGVFKSTDGGTTWIQTGPLAAPGVAYAGFKLVQSTSDANLLIAATSNGMYKTENGGTTWTRTRTGLFYDVEFQPGSNTRVYCAAGGTNSGFRYSTDAGDTWSAATFNDTYSGADGVKIAVAPSNSSVVYLIVGPNAGFGGFRGIYKSTDNGLTFDRQSNAPNILGNADNGSDNIDQSPYNLHIAVYPGLSTEIVGGGTTIWKSTNSGVTMVKSTSFNEGGAFPYIHPDVHDIAYCPISQAGTFYLYAATDGGIYRSTNRGSTWTDLNPAGASIRTTQFYHASGFEGNVNLLLGGSQDNGLKYRDANTAAFKHVICCDGFESKFWPNNSNRAYASVNQGVNYTSNLPDGWGGITPYADGDWFANVATDPADGATVYVASDTFWKSTNSGSTFPTVRALNGAWCFTSCPSNSSRLYMAGGSAAWSATGSLRRSDDGGNNWAVKSLVANDFPSPFPRITDVAVDPTNSLRVWVTFGGFTANTKVYYSNDGGENWFNRSNSLPNLPVLCVAVDNANNAYIGTDIGVYYRGSGQSDWTPFYNYLPRTPVTDLIINQTNSIIRAATFGQGIWQSPLYTTCDENINLTGTLTGYKFFEAGNSITATTDVFGGAPTEVFFKSENYIELKEGFHARDENNSFNAYLGPCGAGGIPTARSQPGADSLGFPATLPHTPKTLLPFGRIKIEPAGGAQMKVAASFFQEGNFAITMTDAQGKVLKHVMVPTQMTASEKILDFNTAGLSKGLYYLRLFRNNELVHYQEYDVN